ncbi:MAG: hypothetical protein ACYS8Z_05610, partial [Planctomycetota bacterium]
RRERPFGTPAQWKELFDHLETLGEMDNSLIELHYVPFMARFNDEMNAINDHLKSKHISEAINARNDFLAGLETDYKKTKDHLKEMTETISVLTGEL